MRPFDDSGIFVPPAAGSALRRKAVRGAGATVISQGLMFAVQMISTAILARILEPGDFGVVAMGTTFSILLMSCVHVGFPDAVLQRDELEHPLASNLFWINIAFGLVLTAGFGSAGWLLARFYGDARLVLISAALSLSIVFDSAGALHLALLRRAMQFATVSAIEVTARAVSVAVSVILGVAGCGYWALIGGAIAVPLTQSIGGWTCCRWAPALPRRVPGTMRMVRFAAHVLGRFGLGYATQNMDNLLVGLRFGPFALGVYKKAYDLFVMPSSLLAMYSVGVSTLSRLTKERDQYQRYFLGGVGVLAFGGFGIAGVLTLVAGDIVRLLLGPQWEEAGRVFRFFGPGIGVMLVYNGYQLIHLSVGTADRFFKWGIVEMVVTGALFFLTVRWGPQGIAAAWTASYCILFLPAFWYAGRAINLQVTSVVSAVWRFMLSSLLAAIASGSTAGAIPSLTTAPGWPGAMIRLAALSAVFGTLYLGAVTFFHRGPGPLLQVWALLREMVPLAPFRRKSSAVAMLNPRTETAVAVAQTTIGETR